MTIPAGCVIVRARLADGVTDVELSAYLKTKGMHTSPKAQKEKLFPWVCSPVRNGYFTMLMSVVMATVIEEYILRFGFEGYVSMFLIEWPFTITEVVDGEEVEVPGEYGEITWEEPIIINGVKLTKTVYGETSGLTWQEPVMRTCRMGDIA